MFWIWTRHFFYTWPQFSASIGWFPTWCLKREKSATPCCASAARGFLDEKDVLIEIIEMVKHTTNYDEKRHDLSRGITRFLIQDYKIRFWEHAFGGWRTILCHGVKYAKKRGFSDRFTTCFLESPTVLFGLWISMNAIYGIPQRS